MKGLILDDDRAICDYIASALDQSGVDYQIFQDPVEALGAIGRGPYDFGFVDIHLPNMDGLEFSRRFKIQWPEADIIFITGYGDYNKAVQAIRVGAYDYLQKPFRRLDIMLCLSRLIEKRKLFEDQKRMEVLKFANEVALELMHELRNPLVAIGGFSRRLSTGKLAEDTTRKFAHIIFEESVRLETVLNDILEHLKGGARPYVSGVPPPHAAVGPGISCNGSSREMLERTNRLKDISDRKRRSAMARTTRKTKGRKAAKASEPKKHVQGRSQAAISASGNGIQKRYLPDKKICQVTFRLPKIAAEDAKRVCVVGDFNDWRSDAAPMKRLKNGDYAVKLELQTGREYQFRYLIDESKWENDWNADGYVRSPFGDCDNSVVKV
ncbi:MAG: response regulator [Deltaproteobacteria bacterium]|nr:response regulator [Deltaproteobacteria bacterium]